MGRSRTDGWNCDELNGWNREAFVALVDKAGISKMVLAAGSGVSQAALNQYYQGRAVPGYANILKLADFFAVPLDLLAGRCDEETAHSILDNYNEYFMRLRRAPYEAYLRGRRPMQVVLGFESPYPYNLLDDIFKEQWCEVVTQDQLDGIEQALTTLTERERQGIDGYYKRGLTLEGVGREFNITRERTRQILAKALRKLRHPARKNLIVYGLETAKEMSEIGKLKRELTAMEYALNQWQTELDARAELMGYRDRKINGVPEFFGADKGDGSEITHGLQNIGIEDLELSVRSYNCLKRAGVDTVADILKLSEEEMTEIRNLGKKSLFEVIDTMHALGLRMSWEGE